MEFLNNLQTWSTTIISKTIVLVLITGAGTGILTGIKTICKARDYRLTYRIIRAIFLVSFAILGIYLFGIKVAASAALTEIIILDTLFFIILDREFALSVSIINLIIIFAWSWWIFGSILIALFFAFLATICIWALYNIGHYLSYYLD